MKFDPERRHRRSIRLKDYDYAEEGAYFVTICTWNREFLFGEIQHGEVVLSKIGKIVQDYWLEIPKHFENVRLDEFVVMPNHIHGIIVLEKRVEYIQPLQNQNDENKIVGVQYIEPTAGKSTAQGKYQHVTPKSIGSVIRSYKAIVTRWCRENSLEGLIWQRNYWEHVIRSEETLNKIRGYIIANPAQWEADPENPAVGARGRKDEMPEGLARKA